MSDPDYGNSPSPEEQLENYLNGTELPDNMPDELKRIWQERIDRVRSNRGY